MVTDRVCLMHYVWGASFISMLHVGGVPCIMYGDMYFRNISLTLSKNIGKYISEPDIWNAPNDLIFCIFNIYVVYVWLF